MVADVLADRRLVQRLIVDRADQAMGIAIGLEEDRCALAEQQGAVMGGLVVVAVEQHEVALGDQRLQHDLVRSGRAVQHEVGPFGAEDLRSEEHTSELQSLMRNSYAVFCLKNKK